ncbi:MULTISPECIES: hypothetical protein [Mycolicibacterium]|uniref:hypothetical protein n=1 Tax=Mycolicibacterium TaxID=1866885 RepID=UPI0002E5BBA4|nr:MULTISPECIES: hypothetical protein [Mycolicibacterium]OBJ97083.1 hypothetical protein A5639_30640 [Mycolicibacterium conceptionense]OMB68184.1 hypothetical protein A5741_09855 [Mycolicibacterium conceptionense]OMB88563.1 hypothetical protein A5746_24085 [Mycolicibacterium conceptionense]
MSDNMIDSGTVEVATPGADTVPVDGQTAAPEVEVDTDESADGGERGAASREAAKYRRQLRDVEAQRDQIGAERDQLADRIATMQRVEAERLAVHHLADGADMWRDGLELSAVLDDDGNLDPAKVTAAAKAARKAHPHWAASRPYTGHPKRGQLASGATGYDGPGTPKSWQEVISDRSRG